MSSTDTDALVRAIYTAVAVPEVEPPFNTVQLKVLYPARLTGSPMERNFGVVAPDPEAGAPWPVVLFLSGINVPASSYQWLGETLARRGFVFVSYDWVASPTPGQVALTPGLDISAVTPERYGSGPTAPVLRVILDEIDRLNRVGLLEGRIDATRVVLGGHSAGGSVALHNARGDYFEEVVAGFSYGAHAAASTMLGHPPATFLNLGNDLPLLLIGGSDDGVIAHSAGRYGLEQWAEDPIETTWARASEAAEAPRYYACLQGASHFLVAHPHDRTSGRAFLEGLAHDGEPLRARLAELVSDFCLAHAGPETATERAGRATDAQARLAQRLTSHNDESLRGRVADPRRPHAEPETSEC